MEYVGQFFIKKKRTSSYQTGKMLPRRLPGSGLVCIKAKYSKFTANPSFAVLYPLPASWPKVRLGLSLFTLGLFRLG